MFRLYDLIAPTILAQVWEKQKYHGHIKEILNIVDLLNSSSRLNMLNRVVKQVKQGGCDIRRQNWNQVLVMKEMSF